MWSSSRIVRISAFAIALLVAPALAACTGFTPVYGPDGLGAHQVAVKYGAPGNRLEQIIYEDLALKLGKSNGAVPMVHISASASPRNLTVNTAAVPVTQLEMTVTANISVTDASGKVLFTGSRSASADYTTGGQAVADQQAASDASERAAKALADTVRLQVIAVLGQ